ncbi:unnamed protein product [Gongylonema pulchrum]|uniref:C2H2-type domain-containing protein n=1 Tax=Gongylonema pulchrum TaxID=637853 RepID=A0A3P7NAM7_9BILA|nr:unnamed protein product [Gongylonema pulchrum]
MEEDGVDVAFARNLPSNKDLSSVQAEQQNAASRLAGTELLTELGIIEDHDDSAGEGTSSNMANPVRTKWSSSHGMVQCSECSRTFLNITRLEKHIAGVHQTTGAHPCLLCGSRFKNELILLNHYRYMCPYTRSYIDEEKREQVSKAFCF